jgi:hypothetical protein
LASRARQALRSLSNAERINIGSSPLLYSVASTFER